MSGPYDVLADAYAALLELTERVYLPDQSLPDDETPLIRLDLIGWTDRARYGSASALTRIQVSVWANSLDAAISLHQQARERLVGGRSACEMALSRNSPAPAQAAPTARATAPRPTAPTRPVPPASLQRSIRADSGSPSPRCGSAR